MGGRYGRFWPAFPLRRVAGRVGDRGRSVSAFFAVPRRARQIERNR